MTTKKLDHGLNLPKPPELDEELRKQLAEESRQLREEFRRRIEKMWVIPADEMQARSR